jgi:hypothetical protein
MNFPVKSRYLPLLGVSIVVILLWVFSVADPCLIAFLRGGPPSSANPIAITSCKINEAGMILITNGDAIVRLAALALSMGLFGIVGGIVEPARRKRSFAGLAVAGATYAFAIYVAVQFVVLPGASFGAFHVGVWAASVVVGSLASLLGAAIAASTLRP